METSRMIATALVACNIFQNAHGSSTLMTSCSANNLGSSASVTCHFSEDLSASASVGGIDVQRYNIEGSNPRAESVAECYFWAKKGISCTTKDGFSCTGKVSNELTVSILNVTPATTGKYRCNVLGDTLTVNAGFCYLKIRDPPNWTEPPDKTASIISTDSDEDASRDNETGKRHEAVSIAVPVTVIGILIIVTVIAIFGYRRKWFSSCRCFHSSEENGNEDPDIQSSLTEIRNEG